MISVLNSSLLSCPSPQSAPRKVRRSHDAMERPIFDNEKDGKTIFLKAGWVFCLGGEKKKQQKSRWMLPPFGPRFFVGGGEIQNFLPGFWPARMTKMNLYMELYSSPSKSSS